MCVCVKGGGGEVGMPQNIMRVLRCNTAGPCQICFLQACHGTPVLALSLSTIKVSHKACPGLYIYSYSMTPAMSSNCRATLLVCAFS